MIGDYYIDKSLALKSEDEGTYIVRIRYFLVWDQANGVVVWIFIIIVPLASVKETSWWNLHLGEDHKPWKTFEIPTRIRPRWWTMAQILCLEETAVSSSQPFNWWWWWWLGIVIYIVRDRIILYMFRVFKFSRMLHCDKKCSAVTLPSVKRRKCWYVWQDMRFSNGKKQFHLMMRYLI